MQDAREALSTYAGALAVIGLAAALAVAAMWWLGYDFSELHTVYIGDDGDTVLNGWAIHQALDNLLHRPLELGHSTIFYGEDAAFGYTIAPYGIAVFVLPLYLLSGQDLVLTYNLYLLATFVLTAWAAHLLIAHLLRPPRGVSVIAALMVAFAPFRFLHLAQIETLSTQFLLLALYCFHRTLDTPRLRWAVGLALAAWFTALTSGYLAVIGLVAGGVVLLVLFLRRHHSLDGAFWRQALLAAGIALVLALPFLGFRLGNDRFREGWDDDMIRAYAAEPGDWFAGSTQVWLNLIPSAGEATIFLGFTPLVLAGLAGWHSRRDPDESAPDARRLSRRVVVTLYGLVTLAGYALTLGPVITVDGARIIPSPYALLMQLPLMSSVRVPARFIMLPLVGTALLSAYALARLVERVRPALAMGGLLLVVAALGIEFTPYNGADTHMLSRALYQRLNGAAQFLPGTEYSPQPVYRWLDEQPDGTPVLHIPFHAYTYYAYQPHHNQPMLNGAATYEPDWVRDIDWAAFPTPAALDLLRARGVRYVLVHHDLLAPADNAALAARWTAYDDAFAFVGMFGGTDVYAVAE